MSSHAGVRPDTAVEQLIEELNEHGEVYVSAPDASATYRVSKAAVGSPITLSWLHETGPRKPVLWHVSGRMSLESREDWTDRVARGFLFAVLAGIDLRGDA